MTNWKTTLGGACSAFGTALMGIGVLSAKDSSNITILWWTAFAGFVLCGLGTFFGHLFAADSKKVETIEKAVVTGNTDLLTKKEAPDKPQV